MIILKRKTTEIIVHEDGNKQANVKSKSTTEYLLPKTELKHHEKGYKSKEI